MLPTEGITTAQQWQLHPYNDHNSAHALTETMSLQWWWHPAGVVTYFALVGKPTRAGNVEGWTTKGRRQTKMPPLVGGGGNGSNGNCSSRVPTMEIGRSSGVTAATATMRQMKTGTPCVCCVLVLCVDSVIFFSYVFVPHCTLGT